MTESEKAGFYAFATAIFVITILIGGVALR